MLLVLRCFIFIGVCVEFVAAVAWLAELFPDREPARAVLGYTQAFSSLGGLLVTAANVDRRRLTASAAGHSRRPRAVALHADLGRHSGAAADPHPAVPARVAGVGAANARRARSSDRASPSCSARRSRQTTIVTDADVRLRATAWRSARFSSCLASCRDCRKCASCARPQRLQTVNAVQMFQEMGGLLGRFALAFLAVRIVSRRKLLHVFQIPGLVLLPIVFLSAATSGSDLAEGRDLPRGLHDRGANELLGELPAARLSHASARHRRRLCRQRRRPHDWHRRSVRHRHAGQQHARRGTRGEAGLRGGARRARRST